MLEITSENLPVILSSSAALGVAIYVFRLTGALVTDAKAYHDDREMSQRLFGPFVAVGTLSTPVLLVSWFLGEISLLSMHTVRAFLMMLIQGILLYQAEKYSEQKNRMRSALLESIDKMSEAMEASAAPVKPIKSRVIREAGQRVIVWIETFWKKHGDVTTRFVVIPAITTLALYLTAIEVMSGNIVWSGYFVVQFFVCFVLVIGLNSLFQVKRGRVTIVFKDLAHKPMELAVLLKITNEFTRVIHDGKIHIISRDVIARFETPLNLDRYLDEPEAEPLSPKI